MLAVGAPHVPSPHSDKLCGLNMPSPRKQKTCGSNLPFAITESEGDSVACSVNDFHILASKFALRISILDSSDVCCIQPALHEQK